MKKHEIIFSLIKIPLDFCIMFGSFFLARNLREIGDFLPKLHLPIQWITNEYLFGFAIFGSILYITIFFLHGLYSLNIVSSKLKEMFDILRYGIYFFLFFSVFIYFGKGIFYSIEIPRLVIIFTVILASIGSIIERIILNKIQHILLENGTIQKRNIALITSHPNQKIQPIVDDIKKAHIYHIVGYLNSEPQESSLPYLGDSKEILEMLKKHSIDELLFIDGKFSKDELYHIWDASRIAGVSYRYITNSFDITKTNTILGLLHQIPVVEIQTTALGAWGRVLKRMGDLGLSMIGLILWAPLFLLIWLLIKLEDPSGPIIYKNTRIGQNGKKFNLYKFRYLKWKYCIKESYGVENGDDSALAYEKELIEKKSKRKWPLYKIENDPRKTKVGAFIEKYSLDELPQLFNVLLGNMSLVGPRPHQPREVEKYDTWQKRVLTIKPGITGIAQVNGRENNSFDDEVKLDIFYIENWNFLLDIKIFLKTFSIVINRK